MQKIRHAIFETNSSSSHSISVKDLEISEMLDTGLLPDESGYIVLTGGQFGWEWEAYNDAYTKANYCAVDQIGNRDNLEMLKKVLREQTAAKDVIIKVSTDYNSDFHSYIDHDSEGTSNYAFTSEEKLRDFIFNKRSFLFTGNGNSEAPPNFYDVDPGVVFKYEMRIEGLDTKSYKFGAKPKKEELQKAIECLMQFHPLTKESTFHQRMEGKDFDLCTRNQKTIDGRMINSFSKLSKKVIRLFKKKSQYSKDEKEVYLGNMVFEEKDLPFSISKIEETVVLK
jgi:hypothetical protein